MKKLFLMIAFASVFAMSVFAADTLPEQEKDDSKWTDITYVNIPILKVMEANNGYLVIYQKNKVGTGSVIIPKSWSRGNPENPRKLKFRKVRKTNESFLTVVKKGGEFQRVVITIPMNKQNPIWSVTPNRQPLEGIEKDTLEEIEL